MAEHPNVARIRRGYDIRSTSTAFSDSDWDEIKGLFHENLVYHGQGTSRYAQDFTGRDEFFAVERQFAERSTMHQEVQEIYADDVHAIVTVVVEAQNGDVKATWREAEVFHFDADGKVSDTWGIPMDQEVVDDFWATFAEAGVEA
jgi:SnoaL-like domain